MPMELTPGQMAENAMQSKDVLKQFTDAEQTYVSIDINDTA